MPSNISPRICPICGQEFIPRSPRQKYCQVPHPKKHVCRRCGREFYSTGKPALCEYCIIQHCVVCGKEFTPKYPYDGKCCSDSCRAELRARTNLEKYGVDSPFKRPEVQHKIERTFVNKYGGHPMTTKEVQDKIKATNIKRYGVEHPAQNEDIKRKGIETQINRYGGIGYGSEKLRAKIVSTNRDRYGANTPFESDIVQDTIKQVNLERYGYENPMHDPQVRKHLHEVFDKKYGTWAIGAPQVRQKIASTVRDRFGVDYALQSPEVQEKIRQTNLDKFGVEHPAQNPEIRAKMAATCKSRYGVSCYTLTDEHTKQTMLNPSRFEYYLEFCKDEQKYILTHYKNAPTAGTLAKDIGVSESYVYMLARQNNFWDYLQHTYSTMETEVLEFLHEIGIANVVHNDRQMIKPLEIDWYLPDYHFGIECNPTSTHNSSFSGPFDEPPKSYKYHQNKTQLCKQSGITLFHIFGYEWQYRRPIVQSMIRNALHLTRDKLYARNCYVCEVPYAECQSFLHDNHRQGGTSASIRLGLRCRSNDELVSLMTFNKVRANQGADSKTSPKDWELSRFCSTINTNVVGAASKLFRYFVRTYDPVKIVSFSDDAHTSGNLYPTLGFKAIRVSDPDYVWVRVLDDKPFNRSNTMKSNLSKLLGEEVDLSKTEKQIMEEHGYVQVYDSGTIRWEWIPNR